MEKKNQFSALKLILIITGSIIAAAGVIYAICKFCKKNCKCCNPFKDELDGDEWWNDDDSDVLSSFDTEEPDECDCCDCCDCEDKTEEAEEKAEEKTEE